MIDSQNALRFAFFVFCCVPQLTACGDDSGEAHELEYCDVEPLFAEHCTKCHYDGEDAQGPMPLETYEQVFENKRNIAIWVGNGSMPLKSTMYPVTITQEERDLIVEWSQGPAVEGDCE